MSKKNPRYKPQQPPRAWAVRSPENRLVLRGSIPPMNDVELSEWSKKQTKRTGIRQAAVEAAGRGVTLMAFDQSTNTSYPYMPELVEEFKASAGQEEKARMEAIELHGLHGEDLDDFVAQDSQAQAA